MISCRHCNGQHENDHKKIKHDAMCPFLVLKELRDGNKFVKRELQYALLDNARLREQVKQLREALSTVRAYIREADAFVVHIDRTAKAALEATEDKDE